MGHIDEVYIPSFYSACFEIGKSKGNKRGWRGSEVRGRKRGGSSVEHSSHSASDMGRGRHRYSGTRAEASAGGRRGAGARSAHRRLLLPRAQEEGHLLSSRRL